MFRRHFSESYRIIVSILKPNVFFFTSKMSSTFNCDSARIKNTGHKDSYIGVKASVRIQNYLKKCSVERALSALSFLYLF